MWVKHAMAQRFKCDSRGAQTSFEDIGDAQRDGTNSLHDKKLAQVLGMQEKSVQRPRDEKEKILRVLTDFF